MVRASAGSGIVLVTGGAGFIGSHVVDRLVQEVRPVRVVDALNPTVHRARPDYLNPAAEYVTEDVRDPAAMERALRGVDAVCHQAAMVGLGLDFGDVADYVSHNDAGTASLLLAMHRARFRGRLVLGSSMVVYGEGRYACRVHGTVRPGPRADEDLGAGRFEPRCPDCGRAVTPAPVPEDAPLDPRNVYAATKVHQEHLCALFAEDSGVALTVLRYHNVYGPRMPRDTPYAGVASVFRSALEAGRPPRVFEDGRQLRDFVHVGDVARANVLALTAVPPPRGAFNVASGSPRTVGRMAEELTRAFGPASPLPVVTGEYRRGDVRHVFASPERAARELGFLARTPFDRGMAGFARAPLRDPVADAGLTQRRSGHRMNSAKASPTAAAATQ